MCLSLVVCAWLFLCSLLAALADLEKSLKEFISQRVGSILDDDTRKKILSSVFALSLSDKFSPIGVCFFIHPTIAVTCHHTVDTKQLNDFVWAKNEAKEKLKLKIIDVNPKHDFAFLSIVGQKKAPSTLTLLPSVPAIGSQFVVASYQIGIMEELKEFKLSVGVAQGIVQKVSKNHFVYQSSTFAGDSGGALTLIGGNVIGMHLEGVNQARERISHVTGVNDRLDETELSIDSLVRGTAQGALALSAHVLLARLQLLAPP